MPHRIELTANAIDVAAALKDIYSHDAGGVCVFLGTTRSETSAAGLALAALLYEAFEPLAIKQLNDLVEAARGQFPLRACTLLHRTGRVDVAQPSVLIAVATPHRAESFAACKWLIDSLKQTTAIWKKELWADGSVSWVEGTVPHTSS